MNRTRKWADQRLTSFTSPEVRLTFKPAPEIEKLRQQLDARNYARGETYKGFSQAYIDLGPRSLRQ